MLWKLLQSSIYSRKSECVTDNERQKAKGVVCGMLYGGIKFYNKCLDDIVHSDSNSDGSSASSSEKISVTCINE